MATKTVLAQIIERGVAIPPANHINGGGPGNRKYLFYKMNVGYSLLFAMADDKAARIAAAVHQRRNPPMRFAARRMSDGLRIWRVE